jgi:ubiquinone/menaquinone biosynthesis C-methylase UbiE
LINHLPGGPLALADVGCGDGPLFGALERGGYISPARPVYAVDLEAERLLRVAEKFPYIATIVAPAENMAPIPDASLDFLTAMMVMEHVPHEGAFLDEARRVLRKGGRIYLTTVFKKPWAWYFRRRDGETVLDVSHLREYTDVREFQSLLGVGQRFSRMLELALEPLWFPVVDPILFLAAGRGSGSGIGWLTTLRKLQVPVPGYYTLTVVLEA